MKSTAKHDSSRLLFQPLLVETKMCDGMPVKTVSARASLVQGDRIYLENTKS